MKILFIGNSHTYFNDMPHIFQELCTANGIPMETVMLAHGGMGFDFHRKQPEVRFNIRYGGYDYVILQHVAHPFGDEAVMFEAARELHRWIAEAGSKTVLYMTWSEKDNETGQPRMADAYLRLGRELDALVAPVGLAWWDFRRAHPETELYYTDGQHASPAGSTLAACTLFSTIFRKPAAEGDPLAESAAAQIRQLARDSAGSGLA